MTDFITLPYGLTYGSEAALGGPGGTASVRESLDAHCVAGTLGALPIRLRFVALQSSVDVAFVVVPNPVNPRFDVHFAFR